MYSAVQSVKFCVIHAPEAWSDATDWERQNNDTAVMINLLIRFNYRCVLVTF